MKNAKKGEFTGRHMLYIMLGFFGVIIAVNFFMATVASSTWTGLVVRNTYVASQEFNGKLAAAKAQHARGWQGSIEYKDHSLVFDLFDANGKPVALDQVIAKVGRPAFEQKDQILQLTKVGAGKYGAQLSLEQGEWMVELDARSGGEPYRLETRLLLSAMDVAGQSGADKDGAGQ